MNPKCFSWSNWRVYLLKVADQHSELEDLRGTAAAVMAARLLTTRLLLVFFLSEFNYSTASATAGNLGHSQSRPGAQRNSAYRPPQRKQTQNAQTNPWSKVLESLMKIPSNTPASPQPTKPQKTPQNIEISIKWPEGQKPLEDLSSRKPVDSLLKFLSNEGIGSFIKSLQRPKDKDSPMVGKPSDQRGSSMNTHGEKNKHVSKPGLNHRSDPSSGRREPAKQSSTQTGLQNRVMHLGPGFNHPHLGPGFHHPHRGPEFHSLPQHSQSRIPIFHPSHGHRGPQAHGHRGPQAHGHRGPQAHGHRGPQAHGHRGPQAHGHRGPQAHGHRGPQAHGHHPLRQQSVANRLANPKLNLPRWV